MEKNLIPDVEVFAQEIIRELQADLPTQRIKVAERLMNFSPEKMSEIHLQDWYGLYWKLLDLIQNINEPLQNVEISVNKIFSFIRNETNPIRRQYFAFSLLLFKRFTEFQALADKKLWSKNLIEDFDTFSKFNQITSLANNLKVRANVRRYQQMKTFLQNKYSNLIQRYSTAEFNSKNCPKVAQKDYKIWYCWLQGEENLIPLARVCYESLKMNAGQYEICFIDEKNFSDYVELPDYIIQKLKSGAITRTHFSDILRVNLLEKYGGLWLDSTVLVTESLEKYKHFWKMPYFSQKFYQEKSLKSLYADNPSYGRWATFFQGTAILHNPLFNFIKDFFNEYLKDFGGFIDYFLLDLVMDIACDNIQQVKNNFDKVPINNTKIWSVVDFINVPYAKYPYDKISGDTFLFKCSQKKEIDFNTPNTVFREIQKRYAPETIEKF